MTSIKEEHVYLLEFIIKHIFIKPKLLSNSNGDPDHRIRVQFGTKMDSEIQLRNLASSNKNSVFNVNQFRGGLSFLVTMSAANLVDHLHSKPVRIIVYNCHENERKVDTICTCDQFLEPELCKSILLYYNVPHVKLTEYCGDLKDSKSKTVGVVHVHVRISRLNNIIETEIATTPNQVRYTTRRNQILSMSLSEDNVTRLAKKKSHCCCDEKSVEKKIFSTKKEGKLYADMTHLNKNMNKLMEKIDLYNKLF